VEEQQVPARFERGTDGPKVIVAGLDGSESSWRAAAYAGGLARRQNALLALVYVQPYLPGGAALGVPVSEADTGVAEQLLAEIRAQVERVKDASTSAGSSTPSAAIPTTAWRWRPTS
jgi:nucleotide-binding universal stress UspA family protein